jgi:hypothetical protein
MRRARHSSGATNRSWRRQNRPEEAFVRPSLNFGEIALRALVGAVELVQHRENPEINSGNSGSSRLKCRNATLSLLRGTTLHPRKPFSWK